MHIMEEKRETVLNVDRVPILWIFCKLIRIILFMALRTGLILLSEAGPFQFICGTKKWMVKKQEN